MRALRLVFGNNGTATRLLLAGVLPMGTACTPEAVVIDTGIGGAAGIGGSASTGGAGSQFILSETGGSSATVTGPYGWSADTSSTDVPADFPYAGIRVPSESCSRYTIGYEFLVPLPPEGTAANESAICDSDAATTQDSGWAARVTLRADSSDNSKAQGTVTIAPELVADVVGFPTVKAVDLDTGFTVSSLSETVADAGFPGYTFDIEFSEIAPSYGIPPRVVIETRFTLDCGAAIREVRALTALYWCQDAYAERGWASSGDRCIECAAVCEMAASPIIPSDDDETMALSGAVRLALRLLGKLHGALIILAEHDGGENQFDYRWTATSGKILWSERDVALWVPPETSQGDELVQVAIASQRAAAVASLRWNSLA